MNKNYLIGFVILMFALSIVSAFGISSPYFEGNPLKLAPGESKIVNLALQNNIGDKDLSFTASVSDENTGIARIINKKSIYEVPFGTDSEAVDVVVSIPNNALIGETYSVFVNLNQVGSGEGGMLDVSGNIVKMIPVLVGEEIGGEVEGSGNIWIIIGIILVLLVLAGIIIYLTLKRKK